MSGIHLNFPTHIFATATRILRLRTMIHFVLSVCCLLAHLAAPLAGDGIKFHSVGDGTHASQYFVDIGITEAGRWIAQETSGHGTSGGQHLPGKK